ncbi:MAG: FAD-dependent oxidoreductase [Burkholderiaceae bacterium]
MSYPVAVIGAGLSGLYTAHLLAQTGKKVLIIEARDRLGGRICSHALEGATHRVDLGPSWFWPGMNPRIERLTGDLGLRVYPQHTRGATAIEGSDGRVQRQPNTWEQSPASYRVEGGMQSLVDGLHALIQDNVHIKTGTQLQSMKLHAHAVELQLLDASGTWTQLVSQVVNTIPPRLTAQDVQMDPAWPDALLKDMRHTPTWMAGQAKFVAIYGSAFWRESGMSGTAMSHRGPMVEIHDASDAEGNSAALFGFVGASPAYRLGIGSEELSRQSLAQLMRLFGPAAGTPLWSAVQDWAQEPLTASDSDRQPLSHHPMYAGPVVPDDWDRRVWLAGTERSPNYGGYLEGALESAEQSVTSLLRAWPTLANAGEITT